MTSSHGSSVHMNLYSHPSARKGCSAGMSALHKVKPGYRRYQKTSCLHANFLDYRSKKFFKAEELFSNAEVAAQYRGISSLDYINGTFTQAGQTRTEQRTGQRHFDDAGDSEDEPTQGAKQTMTQNKYYEKRSCLRLNLLGCGTKTYLKKSKKCENQWAARARNPNRTQKQAFFKNEK